MGFVPFTFIDFIDIVLVAAIMYWIYRMTKGTNAPYILTGIIAIYQWALRLTATTIVLPFLATMLWRRLTRAGVLAGMLGGLISTLVWPYLGISFDQTLFGFIFSALGVFGVSLVTRHHPEEHVAAVLWEDLPTATQR